MEGCEHRTGKRMYRQVNNELRKVTEKARQEWWDECKEIEELDERGRSDLVYAKVKRLTKNESCRSRGTAIKNDKGDLLTEPESVRNRWKEYMEVLYDKNGKPREDEMGTENEVDVCDDCKGPSVLESEITSAIKEMKSNEAVGVDNIPAEFWKVLGEKWLKELTELCQDMCEKGVWPDDFTRIVMIRKEKKVNAMECEDHRTISLKSHTSKIMLKVLTRRIEAKAKDFISRS